MKYLSLFLLSGALALFASSCSSSAAPVTTSAYEIEQTKRFETDQRQRDLSWR